MMFLPDSPTIRALNILCPNAQWSIIGEDLSTLIWYDMHQARPTNDAIMQARQVI